MNHSYSSCETTHPSTSFCSFNEWTRVFNSRSLFENKDWKPVFLQINFIFVLKTLSRQYHKLTSASVRVCTDWARFDLKLHFCLDFDSCFSLGFALEILDKYFEWFLGRYFQFILGFQAFWGFRVLRSLLMLET